MEQQQDTAGKQPFLRRHRALAWAAVALAAAVLAGLAAKNVLFRGRLIPRNTEALDLRAEELTPAEFQALQAKLPGCAIRWSVPIGGETYDSAAETVTLSHLDEADVGLFSLFPALKTVDAAGCTDYAALLALREALPAVDVRWTVTVGGKDVSSDDRYLLADGTRTSVAELEAALPALPALRALRLTGNAFTDAQQRELTARFPAVSFRWSITVCGTAFDCTAGTLSFAGRTDLTETDLAEIRDKVSLFSGLRQIDLDGCGFSNEQLRTFAAALPGVDVVWSFELCGVTVRSTDAEIDLSGQKIPDVSVVEAALPYFSHLTKVVMCDCGPTNEEMDELNKKYADIRFVWMVHFAYFSLRTDATSFIAAKYTPCTIMDDGDTFALWYCTDLEGLDLGHMDFSDISFLYAMPHLKYLILADCPFLRDITPIGSLKDLTYLELFQTSVTDLSPLLNCTKLEDLNMHL